MILRTMKDVRIEILKNFLRARTIQDEWRIVCVYNKNKVLKKTMKKRNKIQLKLR